MVGICYKTLFMGLFRCEVVYTGIYNSFLRNLSSGEGWKQDLFAGVNKGQVLSPLKPALNMGANTTKTAAPASVAFRSILSSSPVMSLSGDTSWSTLVSCFSQLFRIQVSSALHRHTFILALFPLRV